MIDFFLAHFSYGAEQAFSNRTPGNPRLAMRCWQKFPASAVSQFDPMSRISFENHPVHGVLKHAGSAACESQRVFRSDQPPSKRKARVFF